jgi:hypothetical protein
MGGMNTSAVWVAVVVDVLAFRVVVRGDRFDVIRSSLLKFKDSGRR